MMFVGTGFKAQGRQTSGSDADQDFRPGLTSKTPGSIQAESPAPAGPISNDRTPTDQARREFNRRVLLVRTALHLQSQGLSLRKTADNVGISIATLHRYLKAFEEHGEQGLMPQFHRSGKKPKYEPTEEQLFRLRELALKTGSISLGVKLFAEDPLCPAEWAAELATCRSLPPSLMKRVHITNDLQNKFRGQRTYQLGSFSVLRGDFEVMPDGTERKVEPGDWWEMDDMSINQPFWYENPFGSDRLAAKHQAGIGRQTLFAMDVATGRWLGSELIGRPRDAYRAEDILRFCRKLFQEHGLPRRGLRLERGIWKSKRIAGFELRDDTIAEDVRVMRHGMEDEERDKLFGGLRELGLEIEFCFKPGTKSIEGGFDHLQSVMAATDHANIGRRRGEFERATKSLIAVHAGSAHPKDRGFAHINTLAESVLAACTWLNTHEKHGRIKHGIPDERWQESVTAHPLLRLPEDKLWLFLPETRALKIRSGHVTPHVKGIGPLPFCHPEVFAELGRDYSLLTRFDPSEPQLGAAIFNNEPQNATRNKHSWRVGQYICHAEFAGMAPQFTAAENFDNGSLARAKRYHNYNTTAFRAMGVYGRKASKTSEARDGRGNVAKVERDTPRTPKPQEQDRMTGARRPRNSTRNRTALRSQAAIAAELREMQET